MIGDIIATIITLVELTIKYFLGFLINTYKYIRKFILSMIIRPKYRVGDTVAIMLEDVMSPPGLDDPNHEFNESVITKRSFLLDEKTWIYSFEEEVHGLGQGEFYYEEHLKLSKAKIRENKINEIFKD